MAYRLTPGTVAVSRQLSSLFLSELDSAISHLKTATSATRDRNVHEARKNMKKIRALLRLVAEEVGKRKSHRLNKVFRDTGRKLSEIRDAQAILETVAAIPADLLTSELKSEYERVLQLRKEKKFELLRVDEVLHSVAQELQNSENLLRSLALKEQGFAALEPGMVGFYRLGQKALKKAVKKPIPANLHDLRKRVKDHWYHVRLIAPKDNTFLDARQARLQELEAALGEAHNLDVLQQVLAEEGCQSFAAITERKMDLNKHALALASDLYSLRPAALKHQLTPFRDLWRRPQSEHSEVPKPTGREHVHLDARSTGAA